MSEKTPTKITRICIPNVLSQSGHQLNQLPYSLLLVETELYKKLENSFLYAHQLVKRFTDHRVTQRQMWLPILTSNTTQLHYFGLRRVTTTKGLYVTKLCEDKISVSTDVKNEMDRTQGRLQLTTSPMTTCDNEINVCFLNARSLHKHIGDICNDLYCKNSDVCMFLETCLLYTSPSPRDA